jgi:hypothetical protein
MLLPNTAKTQIESLTNWLHTWPQVKEHLVLVTGPTASGKTELWKQVVGDKTIVEFSGFASKLAKYVARLHQSLTVKTVAEYAGMSYGKKPEVVIVEDIDAADAPAQKALVAFAKTRTIPVICVSIAVPEKAVTDAALHVRMQRPPLDLVAKDLLRAADEQAHEGFTLKDAKRIAETCNCDIRQARLALTWCQGACLADQARQTAFDIVPRLFSSSANFDPNKTADHLVPLMVAENYHKARNLTPQAAAAAADAVSQGDALPPCDEDVMTFFQVTAPCAHAAAPLSSRPVYPSAAPAKKKIPCRYDLLQAVEARIVKSLSWAPVSSVAKEMQSLGMTSITDWEAVRTVAPVGRAPVAVPADKKDELIAILNKI